MEIKLFGLKFLLEHLIIIGLLLLIIFSNTVCGCSKVSFSEGFNMIFQNKREGMEPMETTLHTGSEEYAAAKSAHEASGAPLKEIGDINEMEADSVLDDEKLFIFGKTKFLPECCPNSYSTGAGCACMTSKQKKLLYTRGGNRPTNYVF